MQRIEIDTTPANIVKMMEKGQFHSHQDGQWRYSPYGSDTVYVNDPSEHFSARAQFPNKRAAAICKDFGLIATFFQDGTRSITKWDQSSQPVLWQIYGAKDEGERMQRDWIKSKFS